MGVIQQLLVMTATIGNGRDTATIGNGREYSYRYNSAGEDVGIENKWLDCDAKYPCTPHDLNNGHNRHH